MCRRKNNTGITEEILNYTSQTLRYIKTIVKKLQKYQAMSEYDKICTIGYLIDEFSQYAPGAMKMINELGLFVEPSQNQLCPTYN